MGGKTTQDYREDVERRLITAGTNGIKKKDLVAAMQSIATADMIEAHLTALQAEGKAQRFQLKADKRGGRPPVVWRGTTALLE